MSALKEISEHMKKTIDTCITGSSNIDKALILTRQKDFDIDQLRQLLRDT